MTIVKSLLYCIIDVNILTDSQKRFVVDFISSSVFINDVIHSAVFLLKSVVVIVVILIVFVLTFFSFIIVCFKLLRISRLRIVRSVFSFTLLIVDWFRSILIKLTRQIYIFWYRLQWLILIVSSSLQWNHTEISKSLLIVIRQSILIHWIERKRVLN